jgi:hypothetical protein
MASLDGKLQASLGRGRLANSKLEALGADLGASLFRLVNPVQRRQDFTVINCAVLIVPVKSGLAEIKAFVLDTPRMTVKGQGQIDLGRETLDIGLDPRPKEGLKTGALGKLSLSFSELARAFRLSGHLANPSLALDKTKALETLGKGIGGALLSGPTGLAAGLLGSSEEGGNPCLEALQGKDSQSGPKKDSPESGSKDINKGLKELEKGLQGLF